MAALENMGFIAIMASMVMYLMEVLFFNLSHAATTVTNFVGSAFLLSVVGGFISDAFMTRLNTILIFGALEVVGLGMLAMQAHDKRLQPKACLNFHCLKGHKATYFYSTLAVLALGSGGTRGVLPALGADQFDQKDPKERKQMASYFNFLLLSVTVGASFGVTAIVSVSTDKHLGWAIGFFISMLSALMGFIVLASGKPFYRGRLPGQAPIIRVLQVLVAAVKNRKLPLPEDSNELYEVHEKDEREASVIHERISHSDQFRLLDKAAILPEGSYPQPWKVCTVTQVEEVKILTRMMPIIASTIIMNTCLAQLQTFSILQGNFMDPYLGKIKVPAPSIPVIPLVFMSILIPIYDFIFVPFARKITGHPTGITHLQRVGIGLVLSAISMTVAGFVEVKRKNAFNYNFTKISLFWLSFQFSIFGIADMFTLVGLLEFFYSEAPAGMRSLSTSFSWLSLSLGNFLSSVFVEVINRVTKKTTKNKTGWLYGDNLNANHLELFYWFLAVLSCLNFVNYLYWAKWYKHKEEVKGYEEVKEKSVDIPMEPIKVVSGDATTTKQELQLS
ncbi:hypothetical protein ACLOJK_015795 [Asimina triloba]